MKTNHTFITAGILAGLCGSMASLAGCASVGPNYHKPASQTPAQWSAPLSIGEHPSPEKLSSWWKNFHDPELDSLIERAFSQNLDIKAAVARVRESRAQYGIAESQNGPGVGALGAYQRGALPASLSSSKNTYVSGFDASWEIDLFGGVRRSEESARAEVEALEFAQADTRISIEAEIARNYIELRAYQSRLEIARQNIRSQEISLGITQKRYSNGLSSNLDVQQATALLETTRSQIPSLESAVNASMNRLSVLLALPPGSLSGELAAAATIPPTPPSVAVALPSELMERRPDVRAAERQLAAAAAQIGVAKADLFPKFSLTGAAGSIADRPGNWYSAGTRFWTVGPVVEWNLFDSGRIRANIKVKTAQQEQALYGYEKTVLGAFEDVENGLVAYAKERTRYESLCKAEAASREALRLANELYSNGLASFINVLDAQRSLYQVQDQLVQSQAAVSLDLVKLYKALGGGWET
jgi:NodT family efflux transporter outer membrane factor (OMF) lipoprotein